MKTILTAALLALLATPAIAADSKRAAATNDDGVAKTAQGFFDAWNKHDPKTMVTFWADDATLINPMGQAAHGTAEIEKLLTGEQTGMFKNSTVTVSGFKVTRPLGSGMAFCDGDMTVDGALGPDGSAMPQMKVHLAGLLAKKGGRWVFEEARPYIFVPAPPAPAGTN